MVDANENPFVVKLIEENTFHSTGEPPNRVIFRVTPDLIETRTVNYNPVEPVHMPGQMLMYKNTSSRNFNISNIKLISRTIDEASMNLTYLWMLRSWCMPRFGINSGTLQPNQVALREEIRRDPSKAKLYQQKSEQDRAKQLGQEMLGAPPPVLLFSAYSTSTSDRMDPGGMQHLRRIPVVIQSLNIPYPSDVDYIPTVQNVPMPTIMTIDVSLIETHSPKEYEQFNLNDFRSGILPGF